MTGLLKRAAKAALVVQIFGGAIAANGADEGSDSVTLFELGYAVRHWSADEGLPESEVRRFLSGPEGYLWIGTGGGGLARFNGFEFTALPPRLASEAKLPQITDMLFQASGARWLVGLGGPQIRILGDHIETFDADKGGEVGTWALAEDPDGKVWAARSRGQEPQLEILHFDEEQGRFEPFVEPIRAGYPMTLEFDSVGRLWGTLSQRTLPGGAWLYRLEGNRIEPVFLPGEESRSVVLFRRRNGELALAGGHGIYQLHGDEWVPMRRFEPLPKPAGLQSCVEDDAGNFWLASFNRGLWVCPPGGGLRKVVADGFEFPSKCRALFIGPSDSIWVGTGLGLFQLFRSQFLRAPASERVRQQSFKGIGEDSKGTLWFTAHDRVYFLRPGESMTPVAEPDPSVRKTVITGRRSGSGAWLAYIGGPLFEQQMDGRTKIPSPGPKASFARDVVETTEDLWFSRSSGLYRYRDNELVRDQPSGIDAGPTAIADGGGGTLYASFDFQGLFRYRSGSWEQLDERKLITALAADQAGGVWARFGMGGLGWFIESEWRIARLSELGVPHKSRIAMLCSNDGSLWIQPADSGVIRFDRKEVEGWLLNDDPERLLPQREQFGLADGLPSEHATALPSSIFEDSRSRIWVATDRGTAAYDPEYQDKIGRTERSLPILIEEIKVDDVPQELDLGAAVVLSPEAHRLELRYVGIDFANPEKVTYRYRLRGYDEDWVDAGSRRTAYYQGLPPGNFQFQVMAADRNGLWSEEGASLEVVVEPAWFETTAFLIAAPGLLVLLIGLAVYYRVYTIHERSRLKENFSRSLIEAQEGERKRLAHELHDSLGQEMLVLKGRLEIAAMKRPEMKEQLNEISTEFSETIERARALSHDLRPPHFESLGLSRSLEALAVDVRAASPLEVFSEIDDIDPRLDATREIGLFRVAQEAVANVLKHAGADRLDLSLRKKNGTVTLEICDDGCGFDPVKVRKNPSLGLRGMAERVELFGGTFDCDSAPGRGSKIIVQLKL